MNEIDSPCSLLIRSRIGWHPFDVFNGSSSIGEFQITFRYPPGTEWGEHEYACLKEKLLDRLPKLIDNLKAHPLSKNKHLAMNEIDSPCSLLITSRIGWHPQNDAFYRPSSIGELQIAFKYPPGTEWGEHEYACLKEKLLDCLPKLIDHFKKYPTMMLDPRITDWYK